MRITRSLRSAAPLRAYVDTSVFGGAHDDEFRVPSERFLERIRGGDPRIVVSDLLVLEVSRAPASVRATFEALQEHMELVETTPDASSLAEAYLAARVLPPASRPDALHVAIASVARADCVVSWNFKHLVSLQRIRGFHAVNAARGYSLIEIRSPLEVLADDQA